MGTWRGWAVSFLHLTMVTTLHQNGEAEMSCLLCVRPL